MTLAQILRSARWIEVQAAMREHFSDVEHSLADYHDVFLRLREMQPTTSSMRLCIEEGFSPDPDEHREEIVGKNGTLNRDLDDFKYLGKAADSEYALEEARYSPSFESWSQWLGMQIEPETLAKHDVPKIIAHCLSEMTFFGFDEGQISAQKAELESRADEVSAMTEEERKVKLAPLDRLLKRLETNDEPPDRV